MGHLSPATIRNWGIVLAVIAGFTYGGFRIVPMMMMRKASGTTIESSRTWAKDPTDSWPILSMQISPSQGNSVPAGWQLGPHASLVERSDGSIICVTGVVERPVVLEALATSVANTVKQVAPPTKPPFDEFSRKLSACHLAVANDGATFTKLIPDARGAFEQGVVIFGQPSGILPKDWYTFRMRETAYVSGMKMTILARDSKTGAQVPLEATVVSNNLRHDIAALSADQIHRIGMRNGDGSESLFRLKYPYSSEELIGAPVVDARGNLAAVITLSFAITDLEGRTTDFVGYGMHALKSLVDSAPGKK
jgi:hypothetical protein